VGGFSIHVRRMRDHCNTPFPVLTRERPPKRRAGLGKRALSDEYLRSAPLRMAQLDAKSASTPAMPTSLRPRYTRTSDISEGSRIEKPQLAKYRRYTHNPILRVIAFHEKAGQAAEQEHAREEHRFQDILIARLHHARSTAVCFSGGGIRSATFGLGVLQELARRSDPFFIFSCQCFPHR